MTLKNNKEPFRNHWWIQTGVKVRKRPIWVKINDFFVPCYFEISWMTLKYNRVPLLTYFKLCAAFRSHWWIQAGVTVWKHKKKIGTKLAISCHLRPWNLTDGLEKQKGTSSISTSSYVHHFVAICEHANSGKIVLTSVTLTFYLDPLRCDRRTDGQKDRQLDERKCS